MHALRKASISVKESSIRFFVREPEKYLAQWCQLAAPQPSPPRVRVVPDAVILPPKRVPSSSADGVFSGGVTDRNGQFVAGRIRSLTSCRANYTVSGTYPFRDEGTSHRNEDVIFGGIVYGVFGHLITDTTARAWWFPQADPSKKIVFVCIPEPSNAGRQLFRELFALSGIAPGRLELVERPTRFRSVEIPEEAMHSFGGYRKEWIGFFDRIRARIVPETLDKVYLSRVGLRDDTLLNEELFEAFFRSRGFACIHPETLPLAEQIAIVSGAKELVAPLGTLSHLFLFADPAARFTVLNRSSNIVALQFVIDAARGIRPDYVDAFSNPFPVRHIRSVFFLRPTPFFERVLSSRRMPPAPPEWRKRFDEPDRLVHFAKVYLTRFATPAAGKFLARFRTGPDLFKMAKEYAVANAGTKSAIVEQVTTLAKQVIEATDRRDGQISRHQRFSLPRFIRWQGECILKNYASPLIRAKNAILRRWEEEKT